MKHASNNKNIYSAVNEAGHKSVASNTSINPLMQKLLDRTTREYPSIVSCSMSTLIVLTPHFFFQRAIVTSLCVVILLWLFSIALLKLKSPLFVTKLALTFITLAIVINGTASVTSQNSGVELLIIMLCLKCFEIQSRKDIVIISGLSFFVLLTSFLYNSSLIMWLYSLTAIFSLYFMVSYHHTERNSHTTVKYLLRAISKILLYSLPLTLITFLIVPRITTPLWGISSDSQFAKTGLANQLQPGKITKLSENNDVAFRVKFSSIAPNEDDMYWRGPVFTFYDGQVWNEPKHVTRQTAFRKISKRKLHGSSTWQKKYNYSVTLEPHNEQWLFTLNNNNNAPNGSYYSDTGALKSHEPITSTFNYTITDQARIFDTDNIEPYSKRYLHMPNLYGSKTRKLVAGFKEKINPEKDFNQQMVLMALNYFSDNEFTYTKSPPLLKYDPVDEFLFKQPNGYCEHYASAFTFMMRAAGVPARVVTGYKGGEYNPQSDYYIVRQSNAHAWAEVWINGVGWQRIDPTQAIPDDRIDDSVSLDIPSPENYGELSWTGLDLSQLKHFVNTIDYQWDKSIVGFDSTSQLQFFASLFNLKFIALSFFIFVLTTIAILLAKIKISPKQDLVTKYYLKCCDILEKKGFSKNAYESPNHFARRVGTALPLVNNPFSVITELYCQLRYSNTEPACSESKLKRLICEIKQPN